MKRFLSLYVAIVLLSPVSSLWAADDTASNPQANKQEASSSTSRIQPDKTTKAGIRSLCGEPKSSQQSDSGEVWNYTYGENQSLDIYFQKTGVVRNFVYKSSLPATNQDQQNKFMALAGERPGTVHCDLCPIWCTRTVCDMNSCRNEHYVCQWYSCHCGGY